MHTFPDSDSEVAAHGFQFPCRVEISAMGASGIGLEQTLPHVLRQTGVDVPDEQVSARLSKAGKYVAVRMCFIAKNRTQYEAAQTALRSYPGVKWVV